MVRNIINHIGEEGRNADACRAYLDTYMDEKTSKPQILPDLSSRFQYWWSREMNNVVEVVSERVTPVEFSDTFNDLVREIRTFRRQETTKDESVRISVRWCLFGQKSRILTKSRSVKRAYVQGPSYRGSSSSLSTKICNQM